MNNSIQPTTRRRKFALVTCLVAMVACFHGAMSGLAPGRSGRATPSQSTSDGVGENLPSASIDLVIDDALLAVVQDRIPSDFRVTALSQLDPKVLLEGLAAGDSMVWIGEGSNIPKELWVGTFRPAASALAITGAEHTPAAWSLPAFRHSANFVSLYQAHQGDALSQY